MKNLKLFGGKSKSKDNIEPPNTSTSPTNNPSPLTKPASQKFDAAQYSQNVGSVRNLDGGGGSTRNFAESSRNLDSNDLSEPPLPPRPVLEERLREFYSVHDPKKLDDLEKITTVAQKNGHKWLQDGLQRKYNATIDFGSSNNNNAGSTRKLSNLAPPSRPAPKLEETSQSSSARFTPQPPSYPKADKAASQRFNPYDDAPVESEAPHQQVETFPDVEEERTVAVPQHQPPPPPRFTQPPPQAMFIQTAPHPTNLPQGNGANIIVYPNAATALKSVGLAKYAKELETRFGIVDFEDLAKIEENPSDTFWITMPPVPDKKKLRQLVADVKSYVQQKDGGVETAAEAEEDDEHEDHNVTGRAPPPMPVPAIPPSREAPVPPPQPAAAEEEDMDALFAAEEAKRKQEEAEAAFAAAEEEERKRKEAVAHALAAEQKQKASLKAAAVGVMAASTMAAGAKRKQQEHVQDNHHSAPAVATAAAVPASSSVALDDQDVKKQEALIRDLKAQSDAQAVRVEESLNRSETLHDEQRALQEQVETLRQQLAEMEAKLETTNQECLKAIELSEQEHVQFEKLEADRQREEAKLVEVKKQAEERRRREAEAAAAAAAAAATVAVASEPSNPFDAVSHDEEPPQEEPTTTTGAVDEDEYEVEPKRKMKPVEHTPEPCDNFRNDLTSPIFNTCVCGHPKNAHSNLNTSSNSLASQGSFKQQASMRNIQSSQPAPPLQAQPSAANLRSVSRESFSNRGNMYPALEPCDSFAADVNASAFGMCVCGHLKQHHKIKSPSGEAGGSGNIFKDMAKTKRPSGDLSTPAVAEAPPPPPAPLVKRGSETGMKRPSDLDESKLKHVAAPPIPTRRPSATGSSMTLQPQPPAPHPEPIAEEPAPAPVVAATPDAAAGEEKKKGIAPPSQDREENRARLVRFYEIHNPDKMGEIDTILDKFKGKEMLLFKKLSEKYGGADV